MSCVVKKQDGIGALLKQYNIEKIKDFPDTIICDSFEVMSQKSAQMIAEVVAKKPNSLLCLPAGNTAKRTFEILKQMKELKQVDFSKASFVALDEWLDLEDTSENCTSFMFKYFYEPLDIKKDQITLFNINASELQAECQRMDEFIFANSGIDCVLLGIGMNGHLGLNEPFEDFFSYSKVVDLDKVTAKIGQKYFSQNTPLTKGITLGFRHFFEAGKVILQVGTPDKAEIIERVYLSLPTVEIPATIMKLLENGVVITDCDAAQKIKALLPNYN